MRLIHDDTCRSSLFLTVIQYSIINVSIFLWIRSLFWLLQIRLYPCTYFAGCKHKDFSKWNVRSLRLFLNYFNRCCQFALQSGHTKLPSYQQCVRIPVSLAASPNVLSSDLKLLPVWEMWNGFNLHFPDY